MTSINHHGYDDAFEGLGEIIDAAGANSKAHGFWDDIPEDEAAFRIYLGNKLMLITREVGEAHEEIRDGYSPDLHRYREDGKPEGFPSELADIVIRVFDLADLAGVALVPAIREKMAYNEGRPALHGKKF